MRVFLNRVGFLIHIASIDGIYMDSKKVKVVLNGELPTSMMEMSSFLGLVGYYCLFVEGFFKIARPLHYLT